MSSAIEARPLAGDRASKVKISHLAGKPAPKEMLVDLVRLEREDFVRRPDLSCPNQMVSFGTEWTSRLIVRGYLYRSPRHHEKK